MTGHEPLLKGGLNPVVYQDGMRVVAAGLYNNVRIGISHAGNLPELVLTLDEARELAPALTWVLMEVDAQRGHDSFKPKQRKTTP